MHMTQQSLPYALTPDFAGFREPSQPYHQPRSATHGLKMIRSVVADAGIQQFIYVQGRSGKRYVFSSITPQQVSLYDGALFAATHPGAEDLSVGCKLEDVRDNGELYYVHLLEEGSNGACEALEDLAIKTTQ